MITEAFQWVSSLSEVAVPDGGLLHAQRFVVFGCVKPVFSQPIGQLWKELQYGQIKVNAYKVNSAVYLSKSKDVFKNDMLLSKFSFPVILIWDNLQLYRDLLKNVA